MFSTVKLDGPLDPSQSPAPGRCGGDGNVVIDLPSRNS